MPVRKNLRDMAQFERVRHSLESRVFQSIAAFSLLPGLICFALGFGMDCYGPAQDSMGAEQSGDLTMMCVEYKG